MMKIYIAGAGAMGSRFGYQLVKAGQDVTLLDYWQEHIDAIKENGLKIKGDIEDTVDIPIMKPEEATEKADFVIVFTKAMQLPKMLKAMKGILDKDTKVLCLLNGLGHEEVMREYIDNDSIIMGVTIWTAGLEGPGVALLNGTGEIQIQSYADHGRKLTEEIVDVMNKAELNVEYNEDVIPAIWRKAAVNGTMNSPCALLDCKIGELFASEDARAVIDEIIEEFVKVGIAEGVALDKKEIRDYVYMTSEKAAHHYPSMHQDLIQNKRPTEVDYINGAVARLAKRHNIETPYCEMITHLIHAKEDVLGIKR